MADKVKNSARKDAELRETLANAHKAELELEAAKIDLKEKQYWHSRKFEYNPKNQGVFYFYDVVNHSSCEAWEDEVRRYAHLNPGKPITIYVQTPGGSVLPGFGLYDTLRTLSSQGHHITTVVRGYAASFGAVILQAGDTRLVGKESQLMLHEVSSGAVGKLHELEDSIEFTKKLNARIFNLIAARTGGKWTGPKLYAKVKAKDTWFCADECVSEGFADDIG